MDKVRKILKNPILSLGVILLLAILLRLREFSATGFWFDEAFTGNVIKFSWKEMFDVIATDRLHPPIYYILVRLWSYIFGFTQSGIRSFSVFTGLLSVITVYFIGRDFFDKKKYPVTGLLMAFILAISPFFVSYSIESRSYSLIAFEGVLVIYFSLKYITSKYEKKYLLWLILFSLLLFFTHYLQAVFLVGIVICILFYKYIFTEDTFNKKYFWVFIILSLLLTLIVLIFPIKEILRSMNMKSLWWIPDIKILDTIRYHYSYFFGVIRYYRGVPIFREMIVSISPYIIAFAILVLHILFFVLVMKSKKIHREMKRKSAYLFLLWSITYFGFIFLGLVGINTLVERYTIVCGVVILISFFLQASLLLNWKKLMLIVLPYVLMTMLIKPLPDTADLRILPEIVEKQSNVNRIVFKDPGDYVVGTFYLNEPDCFYLHWSNEKNESWAIPNSRKGLEESDLVTNDLLYVPLDQKDGYIMKGFEVVFENKDFVLMKKV